METYFALFLFAFSKSGESGVFLFIKMIK